MNSPATILVVDDEPLNLAVLSRLLNPVYRVLATRSGASAVTLAATEQPDLILLDVKMPGMDGHAVLAALQQQEGTRDIPVIFVSALGDDGDEELGLALGAVDYVVKPVRPAVVLARVRTQLEIKQHRDRLRQQNGSLEQELARRVDELLLAQELMLSGMAELAETRDVETGNHVLRTQHYVALLARQLRHDPRHADALDEAQIQRIVKAAPMHDIGKIGIPDHILLKPGPLTAEELDLMRQHTTIGSRAIRHAIARAQDTLGQTFSLDTQPESLRYLEVAHLIALYHHERWDGQGYPEGLAGEAIPLEARLMAVADVYDALTHERVYKPAWSMASTEAQILAGAGTQFDPAVVQAFDAVRDEMAQVMQRLID
ncbi:HD-GYP domain-containing protein [Ideonella sp. B508-1]|uniref:HD-GYP domain-containing protein n=1 Tax=Ideonella sp. B508-1 TaxID=137716 RepID=UPI0003B51AAB|nr:HD domain-containing phosphohydrolase [Ideonella sp. B508-1]